MNQFLNSAGLQEDNSCISSAVSLGDFVYISAQMGEGDTMDEQAMRAINKMLDVISEFGLEMRHIVKMTVYLTDMDQKDDFLNIYQRFVEAPYPACTIVEVSRLEKDAMVAIEGFSINTTRYEKAQKESCCSKDCSECSGCSN